MIEFFAWLVLICVVPFVFAMLELRLKESKRPREANRGDATGIGPASGAISFTTEQCGLECVQVAHVTGLSARWRDRCSFWNESKSDAILKELVLHEIGLPSAPIERKTRRSVVLKSNRCQAHGRLRHSGWTSFD